MRMRWVFAIFASFALSQRCPGPAAPASFGIADAGVAADDFVPDGEVTYALPLLSDSEKRGVERTLSSWRVAKRIDEYRTKTKEMYYHALNGYLTHAYPKDELMSISGQGIDTIGNFSLTLIDAIDTAMVMGDKRLFKSLIPLIRDIDFNINVNVSVFETNIRVVGGLLSAHMMAISDSDLLHSYDWSLLDKAEDLARRLLVAFDTPTGIPFGTVNLQRGVAKDETPDVCTACAGTFSLEFAWLSLLTEDPAFEIAARKAVRAVWTRRSPVDLLGNHINSETGAWVYPECTIGGLVDSFYEYLLKSSVGFADEREYGEYFLQAYRAVKMHMKRGDWHMDVHMQDGRLLRPFFYSLGAFWPGVKIMAGDVAEAMYELNAISEVMRLGWFLPEALSLEDPARIVEGREAYPLRPEYVESLWVAYRATKNPTILEAAFEVVDRLNKYSRTKYGFANVKNVVTLELEDKMESFFVAETLKYLYLLFDENNQFNRGNYVFNTEAHPFPVWDTYKSLSHPFEPGTRSFKAKWIPGFAPDTEYRGDTLDAVVSGFATRGGGICLREDWERAKGINVERWRGKMFLGKKGGKKVKKMKKRRKASEV
ncbi:glycoside hydrolase [Chytriomyces sp. MP71]|nr:glycoside hydrolase [Chytriomyces sp. MP71]